MAPFFFFFYVYVQFKYFNIPRNKGIKNFPTRFIIRRSTCLNYLFDSSAVDFLLLLRPRQDTRGSLRDVHLLFNHQGTLWGFGFFSLDRPTLTDILTRRRLARLMLCCHLQWVDGWMGVAPLLSLV